VQTSRHLLLHSILGLAAVCLCVCAAPGAQAARAFAPSSSATIASVPDLPPALLALRGRDREALPNGSHVAFYKDALYADHQVARHLTGAFRITFDDGRFTMHVQLTAAQTSIPAFLEPGILRAIPARVHPDALVLWTYETFPFGMTLDYERKFSYYVAATPDGGTKPPDPPPRGDAL